MHQILHVEVLRKSNVSHNRWIKAKELIESVKEELKNLVVIKPGKRITNFENSTLKDHVEFIYVCEIESSIDESGLIEPPHDGFPFEDVTLEIHTYRVDNSEPQIGLIDGDGDNDQPACNNWILPSSDFEGLWDNLIYDSSIKETLLNYVSSIMFYSEHNVNKNIITWNRLILLHGPPGTGKTSLCKALAQKLTIRLGKKFVRGELIEINSHSLFSKYFSESGKLVMQMFDKIVEHILDEKALIIVLIDEVESLTLSRQNSFGRGDPSDSVRVVNTILTQLDKLKRYRNVLIFTTSNITGAIDPAFVDRADIKQYIGLPSKYGIYSIYKSCIEELLRAGLILNTNESNLEPVSNLKSLIKEDDSSNNSLTLFKISEASEGLSGRALRKLPFLTHAHFIKSHIVDFKTYLNFLQKAVIKFKDDQSSFT